MRVLVTGGAGYIGSHTVRLLLARGHDVRVFDNLSLGHRAAVPDGRLVVGDLCEPAQIDAALAEHRAEAVVHFAALAYVGDSVRDPARYYRANVVGTLNLLDAARNRGVQKFVFSSTCATYGVPESVPITEDAEQRPINPYGYTKLAAERMLDDFRAAYGLGYVALRYFNASGAAGDGSLGEDHDPETHLIPLILQVAAGRRASLDVYGTDYPTPDGTCVRDFVHVDDLAEAHALALEHVRPGGGQAFNLGSGHGYSVREVVRAAEEVTGRPVRVRECPRRPGDPPALVALGEKAHRELGWSPRYTDLRDTIRTAWDWMRAHPDGYAD